MHMFLNFLVLHYCLRVLSFKNLSAEVKFVQINIVFFPIFIDCFGMNNETNVYKHR